MPSLSIAVTANTADLRAQMALANRDVQQLGRSLKTAAADARDAGTGVTDAMRSIAGQMEAARAEAASLGRELKEGSLSGFERLNKAIKEPLEGLSMMGSTMRETAEIAGVMFAVDKLREWTRGMLEAGETAVNMGEATGMSAHQFSLLSNALQLGGGRADDVNRILERLGKNLQEALTVPTSNAAKAATSLGITHEQLQRAATDTSYAIDLLADRFAALERNEIRSTDMTALMGRGWDSLVPILKRGAVGIEELKQKAQELGLVLSNQEARDLEETAEKVRTLSATIEGAGVRAFVDYRDAVRDTVGWLQSLVTVLPAVGAGIFGLEDKIERAIDPWRALKDIIFQISGGKWGASANAPSASGSKGGGGAPGADLSMDLDITAPKPSATPWPTSGGKKGKDTNLDQWEQEVEAYRRMMKEEVAAEEELARAQESRDRTLERTFELNMRQMVKSKQITLRQALGFDEQYSAQLYAQERARLQQVLADDRLTVAEKQKVYDQLLQLDADYQAKKAELDERMAAQSTQNWAQMLKPMADQMATFATDVIDRTESISKAFDQMIRKILDDFLKANIQNLFNSALGLGGGGSGGGGTGGGGSGGGGGGGSGGGLGIFGTLLGAGANAAFGGIFKSLFSSIPGIGTLFGGAGSGVGVEAADVASMWGGGGASDVAAGMAGGSGFFSSIGGLFGKLASMLPGAAGGWVVPQFAQGGIVSVLHAGEHVLPADYGAGLQNMIANGGGGGHTFNMNISAWDARSVLNAGPQLVASINRALRNGSSLKAPT